MTEQNLIKKQTLPELPPISPDDIDNLLAGGQVENLTSKFDDLLASTLASPIINPNELMFLDKKKQDKIASLNNEAKKATAQAKAEVQKVLAESEEEIPTITMTDEESQRLLGREMANIDPEERKKLIKNVKEQLSEVIDELKKINEEERNLNREKYNLLQEMSKTKKVLDRSRIQAKLSKLQSDFVIISRRKKNVQIMKDKYNNELRSLQ